MERINELFDRYYAQTASENETKELMDLLKDPAHDQAMNALLDKHWDNLGTADPRFTAMTGRPMLHRILGTKVRSISRFRWVAAASVLLMAGVATYYLRPSAVVPPTQVAQVILPGSDKAVLTLGDGSTITLDSTGTRILQQGTTMIKQSGGQLQYAAGSTNNNISFNTLRTPRGGQFKLTLPDGTNVWLNAASSITYPTAFTGANREVKVSGEAYFEVAKIADKPFRVSINDVTSIQVLGTSFNINAYADEPYTNTTLLDGRIGVIAAGSPQVILKPGEQARSNSKEIKVIGDTDTEQVTAWKNGAFNFDGTDLRSVLRQLSRWYDVEVVFEGKVPDRRFGGAMQRNLKLDQVLHILEKMNVKFRLEGRTLIVFE